MDRSTKLVLRLAAFQAGDAVACAIPLAYITRDLDRLGCPEELRSALPVLKGASVLGLLAGLKYEPLGALTATALVAYFGAAIGFHLRSRDPLWRSAPAASVGLASAVALFTAFRSPRG